MLKTSSSDGSKRVWLDDLEILLDGQVVDGYEWKTDKRFWDSCPSAKQGIKETPLTESEQDDIMSIVAAANSFRCHFGLCEVEMSVDRTHIVIPSDMRLVSASLAAYRLGHIYISQFLRNTPCIWLGSISHELAHLTGYVNARITLSPQDQSLDDLIDFNRVGLARRGDDLDYEFSGVNEAVTEIIAVRLTTKAACISMEFNDRYGGIFPGTSANRGTICLLRELWVKMAGSGRCRWDNRYHIEEALIRDYFAGTDEFLDELARIAPETWEYLRKLGAEIEDDEAAQVMSNTPLV
jgi:hypothetical protein